MTFPISNLYGAAGGGATVDPTQLIGSVDDSADVSDGTNNATSSTFFTTLNANGVAVDSNFTASSQKTILSVSGASGIMCALVTPTLASSSDTCAVEITVDGNTYTITFTATGSAQRGILGGIGTNNLFGLSTATGYAMVAGSLDANKKLFTHTTGTVDWFLPSPVLTRLWGLLALRFESSLVVKMTTSQNITATTNQERQAGCAYILDL